MSDPVPPLRTLTMAVATALALAACQTTPTAPPVLDLPPPTLAQLDLERWWTSFDDPTLNALIDEALANNLDLQAAMAGAWSSPRPICSSRGRTSSRA